MPDEKALPALPESPNARLIGRSADFDEVISQIKKEVLIEISSFSQSGARQRSYVDRQIQYNSGTAAADFDNLPDHEFRRLFNQTMREARQRGLVGQERWRGKPCPIASGGAAFSRLASALSKHPAPDSFGRA